MARLLPVSAFEPIFLPLRGQRVGVVDGIGNVGDTMIYRATRELLDAFGIEWVRIDFNRNRSWSIDTVLLPGGANMGPLYPFNRPNRRLALAIGKPCIVLPQSFIAPDDDTFERVYVREKASLACCPGGVLAPDLALGLSFTPPSPTEMRDRGVFLRRDEEAMFGTYKSLGDPAELCNGIGAYFELAGMYRRLITDRLHFAIAGLLNGRHVTLLPNSYHKNRSMWETWLADLGCHWAESPDEV